MTREEAIEYLTRCADGLDPDFDCAVSMAVSALRAQQTSGWISVKDRLPQKDEEVLVCVAGVGYDIAYWWETGEPEWSYTGLGEEAPTHWKPLPELPKGE